MQDSVLGELRWLLLAVVQNEAAGHDLPAAIELLPRRRRMALAEAMQRGSASLLPSDGAYRNKHFELLLEKKGWRQSRYTGKWHHRLPACAPTTPRDVLEAQWRWLCASEPCAGPSVDECIHAEDDSLGRATSMRGADRSGGEDAGPPRRPRRPHSAGPVYVPHGPCTAQRHPFTNHDPPTLSQHMLYQDLHRTCWDQSRAGTRFLCLEATCHLKTQFLNHEMVMPQHGENGDSPLCADTFKNVLRRFFSIPDG
jgi:hypothetical protein